MAVVTSIKPQKKAGRVNVYLDGKFAFGIDLDNYLKLNLKVEQELTDEEVENIVKKAEFQKTLDKVLRFSMVRPRSIKEIKGWFKRKKVHESLHKELFEKLEHFDLVDDEKFARWWIEQRQNFKPKPKRILSQELKVKGIDDETILKALDEVELDESKMAKEQLDKNMHRWQGFEGWEKRQKSAQFLLRKGFSWETVKKLLSIDQED
jgi:regulatory protein